MKKHIERRLAYLYSGELASVILFLPVSGLINMAYPHLKLYALFSFWTSFILLEVLLIQGTLYWYSKLKRLRKEYTTVTPANLVRQLARLKKLNVILIIICLTAFIYDYFSWNPNWPNGGLLVSVFIFVFAVLEYINYFHTQLSYDNAADLRYLFQRKVLKPACIKRDINRLHNNKNKNLA
ncbi:general stress protein [Terribacillus sp. DMT04]|uniref:general stress protein n=1 Tax=Terribacillus sp. DMT04 TaxID=2850441 RepID=UPI001C2C06A2|nr:general stress protein [Terribacillus sp. DMT04]QXE02034.1 general stress protein [Terribacillus sp. DMT04]